MEKSNDKTMMYLCFGLVLLCCCAVGFSSMLGAGGSGYYWYFNYGPGAEEETALFVPKWSDDAAKMMRGSSLDTIGVCKGDSTTGVSAGFRVPGAYNTVTKTCHQMTENGVTALTDASKFKLLQSDTHLSFVEPTTAGVLPANALPGEHSRFYYCLGKSSTQVPNMTPGSYDKETKKCYVTDGTTKLEADAGYKFLVKKS